MSSNLNSEDFAILLALESDPFMPMTELADKLGVTRITAKKRVDDLRNRGVIRNPIALYNPVSLDLHRVNVYAHLKSIDKLKILETACDEHPYTHYRVRFFGGGFGLFMQFDIPLDTYDFLKKFFKEIKNHNIIDNYRLCVSSDIRTEVFADLSRYNAKLSNWNFSWTKWFDSINNYPKKLPKDEKAKVDYTKFNSSHFKILRLLTADGSLKQSDIIDKLKLSRTQAHREFNYVMNNYIDKIRFIYNREIFDLTETYVAIGDNITPDDAAQLYHCITDNPPPFRLSLDLMRNDSVLLWGNMSTAQASSFAFSLWKKLESVQIFTLDTKTSEMYWFYPANFDFENVSWKTSKGYLVDEPIERTLSQK